MTQAVAELPHVVLTDGVHAAIEQAAVVCCYGRTSVPRDGYRRSVIGDAETEEPYRLSGQLATAARCALALGLSEIETVGLVRRIARDSMPQVRRNALRVLAAQPVDTWVDHRQNTATIAKRLHAHHQVVGRTLEDLNLAGVVESAKVGESGPHDVLVWSLAEQFREDISSVLNGCWLHDVVDLHTPAPQ